MARYNTPVRDWSARIPADMRTAGRKNARAIKTLQQGVCYLGGRKKKNGCRLVTTAEIRRAEKQSVIDRRGEIVTCVKAWPKIAIR